MAFSRISSFGGYSAYNIPTAYDNDIRNNNTETLAPEKAQEQNNVKKVELKDEKNGIKGNASIENAAISFGIFNDSAVDLFKASGIVSNDMRKAILGMQKDQILHEYQYFVGEDLAGNTSNIIASTEDGMVIKK